MDQNENFRYLLNQLKHSNFSKEQYDNLSKVINDKSLPYARDKNNIYPVTGLYYSLDFANYVITHTINNGKAISNSKLSGILQMIQKVYYEVHEVSLFTGNIEKGFRRWKFTEVYEEYRGYGGSEIFYRDKENSSTLLREMISDRTDVTLINALILKYAEMTIEELTSMSILPENETFIKELSSKQAKGFQKIR